MESKILINVCGKKIILNVDSDDGIFEGGFLVVEGFLKFKLSNDPIRSIKSKLGGKIRHLVIMNDVYNKNGNKHFYNITENELDKLLLESYLHNKELNSVYFRDTYKDHVISSNLINSIEDLYLINMDNLFLKIGKSKNVKRRLLNLNSSSPKELGLLYVIKNKGNLETSILNKFSHLKTKGEWFIYSEEIIVEFEKLKNNNYEQFYK